MADVFISYAREDRSKAEHVARGLSQMGLQAFWDSEIPPGQTWADYIEGKLSACKAVIVLWSEHSTKSQWVREEARMGRERAKLIPVMLDGSQPPFGFGEVQAANLASWNGDYSNAEWTRFAQAVKGAVGVASAPPPMPPQTQQAWTAPPPQPQPRPAAGGWQTQSPPQGAWSNAAGASAAGAAESLSPVGYIAKCFRLFVDGKGRARRAEYGWFFVFAFVLGAVAAVLDISIGGINPYTGAPASNAVTLIVGLALIAPTIAVAARRAHDFGQSGWLAALLCIPYVGFIPAIAFIFIPGQPGANQHGPNPKGT